MALTKAQATHVLGDRQNHRQQIFGIPAGAAAEQPGLLCLESSSSVPAFSRLYLWADNTGVLRYHTSIPTDEDSDGSVLATTAASSLLRDMSNLATTSINTSLVSDTTLTDNLGSSSVYWNNIYGRTYYFNSTAYIAGTTAGKMIHTGATEFGATGGAAGVDVSFFGNTNGYDLLWDTSGDTLLFADSTSITFGTGADFVLVSDGTTLELNAGADNAVFNIGATTGVDVVLQGHTAGRDILWDHSANTLYTLDNAVLAIGTSGDVTITSDNSTVEINGGSDNWVINIGATTGLDVCFQGHSAGYDLLWDHSAATLYALDNTKLAFGTDGDMTITGNNTTIEIDFAADNYVVNFGASYQADLVLHGNDAGQDVMFDASADALRILDSTKFQFGTGAATNGDISMAYNGSTNVLAVTQIASGTGSMTYGADGKGIDTTWYVETASSYIKLDQANDRLLAYIAKIDIGNATVTYDFALSTNSLVLSCTDNSGAKLILGTTGTNGLDVQLVGAGANQTVTWDAAAGTMTFGSAAYVRCGNDTNGKCLAVPVFTTSGDPGTTGSPTGGFLFNTNDKKLYAFDGTNWLATGALT